MLIEKLRTMSELWIREDITKAVIAVSAEFNDQQRQVMKEACNLAGLNVKSIIASPTAAAIAYKLEQDPDIDMRAVIVFDLGHTSLEVSGLFIDGGEINVVGVKRVANFGARDFTEKI